MDEFDETDELSKKLRCKYDLHKYMSEMCKCLV